MKTRRFLRALAWFGAGAATTMLVWAGGLAWFIYTSLSMSVDPQMQTDAIVVLTGGRLRLEAGLDLLGAGRAQKLFVSGVNPHVDRFELMRVAGHTGGDVSRIVVGHDADNTLDAPRGLSQSAAGDELVSYRTQPPRIPAGDARHDDRRRAGFRGAHRNR
jgi:uncharacterized SAM-binding protein YcdF (DUF218 family)